MRILLIDNYDSFTYNLFHLVHSFSGTQVEICRNDDLSQDLLGAFDRIIISPGPGLPHEAGQLLEVITQCAATKPILGICLGHQAIAEAFGSKLYQAETVFHGVDSALKIVDFDEILFAGIPQHSKVGKYHSWLVDRDDLSPELKITAVDEQNRIMAIAHHTYNVKGLQFHPESYMTTFGKRMIENWLNS